MLVDDGDKDLGKRLMLVKRIMEMLVDEEIMCFEILVCESVHKVSCSYKWRNYG